ncbi:acetylcholinesterase-1-like isoform X2 [Dermacentor variabilis]|uniref:acetylcholinesterase-1-like isoform X2 n=1 Tax=Dermacentor variabilis TaxID=34621 RepID=UPI003F5B06DD
MPQPPKSDGAGARVRSPSTGAGRRRHSRRAPVSPSKSSLADRRVRKRQRSTASPDDQIGAPLTAPPPVAPSERRVNGAMTSHQPSPPSPGSFSENSPYFNSRKAVFSSPFPPVSPVSAPSETQISPNNPTRISQSRRLSRASMAPVGGLHRGEEEETMLDKVLERHVVNPTSADTGQRRGKPLLCAVVLVIALPMVALVLFAVLAKTQITVQVDAAWGTYRGSHERVEGGLECDSFLGIPFGNATGGELRFRRPVRPGQWAQQNTGGSAPCLQPPLRIGNFSVYDAANSGSEDCLRLNLWTPSINAKGLPVLVFLHGFQFYYGGNSQELLRGELLSALGNLVVVVPNFRLGPLGFLRANANSESSPGNLALYDQRLALEWTRDNVRFFGGDPERLVLHGYEAGAVSVGYQLLSPEPHWVKGVPRLILQSGSALRLFKNNTGDASTGNVRSLQVNLKCNTKEEEPQLALDCLRKVEPEMFVQRKAHKDIDFVFGPSFDTEFLPAYPSQLLSDAIHSKEVLLGTVSGEGVVLAEVYTSLRKPINLGELLAAYGVVDVARLIALYTNADQRDNRTWALSHFKQLLGDVLSSCPVQYLAEHLSSGNNRVYSYVFVHKPSFSGWNDSFPAQYEDLDFVFGVPLRRGLGTPQEQDLSRRLIKLVATFAKEGTLPQLREGAEWPEFHGLGNDTVEITLDGFSLAASTRAEQCRQIRPHILY